MQNITAAQTATIRTAIAEGVPAIAAFRAQRAANHSGRPVTVVPARAADPTARITFHAAR